jgi:hypothetical protein
MSFETGRLAFRMFYLSRPLPTDAVKRFAAHAAPPLDRLGGEPLHGWVSGRHLLDRRIDESNAYYGGYLRLTLMRAERKIPEALLRAECRMEELARLQDSGQPFLDRKTRLAIRRDIVARLLPTMPPQIKGMTLVHPRDAGVLYAEVLSEQQFDAFEANVRETLGFGLVPVTPQYAALHRRKLNLMDLAPTSFSPECEDDFVTDSAGQDFLTWLWFLSEAGGGSLDLARLGEFAVLVEGPLVFVLEGEGAHETVLRGGCPMLSAEAKSALLGGKKLKRAVVQFTRGDATWRTTLDADAFVFRGLRLPEEESVDPIGRFQERMVALGLFQEAFLALFDRFLDQRVNPRTWDSTRREIHRWVTERAARR